MNISTYFYLTFLFDFCFALSRLGRIHSLHLPGLYEPVIERKVLNERVVVMLVTNFRNVGEAVCWWRQKFKNMLVKYVGGSFSVCWWSKIHTYSPTYVLHVQHTYNMYSFTKILFTNIAALCMSMKIFHQHWNSQREHHCKS